MGCGYSVTATCQAAPLWKAARLFQRWTGPHAERQDGERGAQAIADEAGARRRLRLLLLWAAVLTTWESYHRSGGKRHPLEPRERARVGVEQAALDAEGAVSRRREPWTFIQNGAGGSASPFVEGCLRGATRERRRGSRRARRGRSSISLDRGRPALVPCHARPSPAHLVRAAHGRRGFARGLARPDRLRVCPPSFCRWRARSRS